MKLCMQRYGFLYKQKNARSSRNGNKKRMMVNVCIIVNSFSYLYSQRVPALFSGLTPTVQLCACSTGHYS